MDGVQNRENRERHGNRERRENRERHAVHSSYIWLGGLQGAAAVFAALLVGVLPQIIPELFNPDSLGQFVNGGLAVIIIALLFLGTVIVSLAASLIYRLVSYKHIWYEFGDEEFSFYSGIFNKKRVHAPYRRIQSVDQTASLFQRVFGVCTVQIDTAGRVGAVFAQGRRGGAAGRPVRPQVGGRRGALSGSRRSEQLRQCARCAC